MVRVGQLIFFLVPLLYINISSLIWLMARLVSLEIDDKEDEKNQQQQNSVVTMQCGQSANKKRTQIGSDRKIFDVEHPNR